jgi:DNA-binding protein WhiA
MEELTKCDKIIFGMMRNQANRAANCDTGNLVKQINASDKQIKIISGLIERGEIKDFSKKLQETAYARVNNPDATYEQLAELLGITKSGLVHRLQKIIGS